MNEKNKKGYLRNTKTSNLRTVRIEVVGGVAEEEKQFLDGLSYFIAGTMSKNDLNHTKYVSELMAKLIKHVVNKMKAEREKKNKETDHE